MKSNLYSVKRMVKDGSGRVSHIPSLLSSAIN